MGALYRRGQVWWAKYYVNGRPVRESTGVRGDTDTPPQEAKRFLKVKEGKAANGEPVLRRADRVRYDEAEADLRRHYETTGERDLDEADGRLAHLKRYFTGHRIATIGPADVTAYAQRRQQAGAANGTINRELAMLARMLRIAYKANKLARLPVIEKLKEAGARKGFFEPAQYEAVRRRLPGALQAAVTIAYAFGWRMQSEVLTLERRQLDLKAGTLRLDPGTTKNDEGGIVYLTPELKALLAGQVERVEALQRRLGRIVPFLFPHLSRGTRGGQRRDDFRKAWATACRACCATTAGAARSATGSTPVSLSAWP